MFDSTQNTKKNDPRDISITNPSEMPQDSIQVIKWSPMDNSNVFAAGGWDEHLRVYQVNENPASIKQMVVKQWGSPILDLDWLPDSKGLIAATGDGSVRALEIQSGNLNNIYKQDGVGCIKVIKIMNNVLILSLSFMRNLQIYLLKDSLPQLLVTVEFPEIPTCMDYSQETGYVFIGVHKDLYVYNLKNIENGNNKHQIQKTPLQSPIQWLAVQTGWRDTSKYSISPTKSKRLTLPDDSNPLVLFSLWGVDGRVYIGLFDPNTVQSEDIVLYKAHSFQDKLYGINSSEFWKAKYFSLLTLGSDGMMYFWDVLKKGKSNDYNGLAGNMSITTGSISPTSTMLAFATGYDWHKGVWGVQELKERPNIHIHGISNNDLKSSV